MKKKFILVACTVFLLAGCTNKPKLQDGKEVIASIKDKNITVEELYNALKERYGADELIALIDDYIASKEYPTTDEITKQVEEQYNSQKEESEEYYGVGFDVVLSSYGYTEESYKKYLLSAIKQEKLVLNYTKKGITDEEVNKYYEDNYYGKITARHILITPEKSENMTEAETKQKKNEAYDLAVSLIKRLDNGEKFEDLAKEYSDDVVTAKEGGLLDPFDKNSGLVNEFWEASLALEVGKYTKTPIETQYGYHIILKEAEEEKPTLEEKKDEILDTLAKEKLNNNSTESIYKALYNIRKDYNLEIIDTDIKSTYEENMEKYKD